MRRLQQPFGVQRSLLNDLLREPSYRVLLGHARAELGAAALPSQRVMLQEVTVVGDSTSSSSSSSRDSSSTGVWSEGSSGIGGSVGGEGSSSLFVWQLGMQANGCWLTTGISLVAGPGSGG